MGIAELFGIGKEVKDISIGIGDGVSKIVSTVKGEIPPDIQGEIEKLKITTEARITEVLVAAEGKTREFWLQYEGSAAQVPKWVLTIRSLIRPAITIFYFGWFMAFTTMDFLMLIRKVRIGEGVVAEDFVLVLLPAAFWAIFGIVVGFWFGGRAGEHIVEKWRG